MTTEDLQTLSLKNITTEQFEQQLACFEKGFPYLKLYAAASVGRGIMRPDAKAVDDYVKSWESYLAGDRKILKFVPASGAASRMFKNLFEFLDGESVYPDNEFMRNFFAHITEFAFYDELDKACRSLYHKGVGLLISEGSYKDVVAALLKKEGLNYGQLPKGLLLFHRYDEGNRTPFEEHLVEGALYAAGKTGDVHVHFTVSPEHRDLFAALCEAKKDLYARKFGVTYHVSFSEQKPSTDTVAVDMENKPFRVNGELLFRPGGHGALIRNLDELDADVVFIKNIDNVVPDRLKGDTVLYKKVIAGVLVSLQQKAFGYLAQLEKGTPAREELLGMLDFLENDLCCLYPAAREMGDEELAAYLRRKLDRPMRVCGMVQNVGEPGGGPFLAYNPDGSVSPQILESSQIDKRDPEAVKMFEQGTHFNPVDLVCALRNYKGEAYDLPRYVDPQTGFISQKSKNGRDLKALELPGLWNGSMSDWNTVFVEVPLSTFNPVKTVNDLLREQHQ